MEELKQLKLDKRKGDIKEHIMKWIKENLIKIKETGYINFSDWDNLIVCINSFLVNKKEIQEILNRKIKNEDRWWEK